MANGGFKFLLLTFQNLVGWGILNLVINMNLFRFVHFENYHLPAEVLSARRQGAASRFIGSLSVRRQNFERIIYELANNIASTNYCWRLVV
jgi:hypothetical protein